MRVLKNFTIYRFFLFSTLCIMGIGVAHSASCPGHHDRAGIQISHYLEDVTSMRLGKFTQITEYNGTVGIDFDYIKGDEDGVFWIGLEGSREISKTIKGTIKSKHWNCDIPSVEIKATVTLKDFEQICDAITGAVTIDIFTKAKRVTVKYYCITSQGHTFGPFYQRYLATNLHHRFHIDYKHEAFKIIPYKQGVGSYKWTLLFRKSGKLPIAPIINFILNSE
jgi:hypothetical protein